MSSLLCVLPGSDTNVARWPKRTSGPKKKIVYRKSLRPNLPKVKKKGEDNFEQKFLIFTVVYWPENNFGTWQHCPRAAWYLHAYCIWGGGSLKSNFLHMKRLAKHCLLKKYFKLKKIHDAFFWRYKFKNI
jgi:hypothetical protein